MSSAAPVVRDRGMGIDRRPSSGDPSDTGRAEPRRLGVGLRVAGTGSASLLSDVGH
jgi:hypothetical protein